MELPANKLLFCAAVALAALASPASGAAEPVVPPENSAATQYTEAIPTGGGQQDAGKAGHDKKRSPSSVLGSKKAKKLDAQGPQGHAAAQIAAETAPAPIQPTSEASSEPSSAPSGSVHAPQHTASQGEATSHNKRTRQGNEAKRGSNRAAPVSRGPDLEMSGGSSGLGEVLGQATGASAGGELGLLLPLLVLGTLAWALLYGLRRKRPAA